MRRCTCPPRGPREKRRRRRGNSPERILTRFLRPASRGVLREDRGRDAEATKGPGRASPSRRFPGGQVRPAAHAQAPQTTASAKIPESGRAQTRRGLLRRPLTSAPGRPRRDQASPARHVTRRPKAITGSLEGGEPFQWGTVPSLPPPPRSYIPLLAGPPPPRGRTSVPAPHVHSLAAPGAPLGRWLALTARRPHPLHRNFPAEPHDFTSGFCNARREASRRMQVG